MDSFEITLATLDIFKIVIEKIRVNRKKCIDTCTSELFATEHAYNLVKKGIPFRDAYKKVAKNLGKLGRINPAKSIQASKHLGATGNLGLDKIKSEITKIKSELDAEQSSFHSKLMKLVK